MGSPVARTRPEGLIRRLAKASVLRRMLWALAIACLATWGLGHLRRWAARETYSARVRESSRPGSEAEAMLPVALPPAPEESVAVEPEPSRSPGERLGVIRVPRVGLEALIVSGVEDAQLDLGAGHFPETPEPGETGNVALAGHRDSDFRPLREVREGDLVEVTTEGGTTRYRVLWTEVVEADETWVLEPTEEDRLTLVTCYPFSWIGPAPQRYVVRAEREQ